MAHLVLSGIPPEGLDLGSEGSSWLRLNEKEVSVACVELMAVAEVGTRHDCIPLVTGGMYCWIHEHFQAHMVCASNNDACLW